MFYPISYNEPLFRPPSEAYSLILQPTIGCSWNRCAFCEMYTTKKFRIREIGEVRAEIRAMSEYREHIKNVFLADGNAMVLPSDYLLDLLSALGESFQKLNRVSAYALPKDLINKSEDELIAIHDNGLKLIYVGIESGDDEVLKMVNKGETYDSTAAGLLRAKRAGIKSSVMILTGLGGKRYSHQHAVNSARIVNTTQPEYLSTLVLSYPHGLEYFKKRFKGEYEPSSVKDLLQELRVFIEHTELERSIFRSDHASNYLVLKGTLGREKERMLAEIDAALIDPGNAGLRPDWLRRL